MTTSHPISTRLCTIIEVTTCTMTFNGIGVLATVYSSNAQRMDVVWHDYMTWNDSNGQLDAVGPITTDNNYSPNDDNALTWQQLLAITTAPSSSAVRQ